MCDVVVWVVFGCFVAFGVVVVFGHVVTVRLGFGHYCSYFLPLSEVESALECFDAGGDWADYAVYWGAHSALEC